MTTPFSVEDLYLHKKITGIALSPAGDTAVCCVRSVDREANAQAMQRRMLCV